MGRSAYHIFTQDYTAGMPFASATLVELTAMVSILGSLVLGLCSFAFMAWAFLAFCIPHPWMMRMADQFWAESVGAWLDSTSSGIAFKIALASYSSLLVTGTVLTWKFGTGQKPGELSPRTWLWSLGILFMTAGFAWLIRQTGLTKPLTTD